METITKILVQIDKAHRDLTDENRFRELVAQSLPVLGVEDIDFANELAVSRSTVARWKNGRSVPHPAMRKPVYASLRRMAVERLQDIWIWIESEEFACQFWARLNARGQIKWIEHLPEIDALARYLNDLERRGIFESRFNAWAKAFDVGTVFARTPAVCATLMAISKFDLEFTYEISGLMGEVSSAGAAPLRAFCRELSSILKREFDAHPHR